MSRLQEGEMLIFVKIQRGVVPLDSFSTNVAAVSSIKHVALKQAAQSRRLFKNGTQNEFINQIENMVSNKVVCEI